MDNEEISPFSTHGSIIQDQWRIVKPIMVEELTQDTGESKIMKPFVQETDLVIQTQSSQVENTPFLSIIIPA